MIKEEYVQDHSVWNDGESRWDREFLAELYNEDG